MSDSSDDDDANLPSASECDRRCKEFAEVTGTDTALAMFFLQDRQWSLERAVNDYFASTLSEHWASSGSGVSKKAEADAEDLEPPYTVDLEPHRVRVLSWNIDGLDHNSIELRTRAVCQIIDKEKPHIVYLQEVVPETLEIIQQNCSRYRCVVGRFSTNEEMVEGEYFVVILLQKDAVKFISHEVLHFHSSRMGRALLKVQATVKDIACTLMTSHLESTASHVAERKRQLKTAFDVMKKQDSTVIFGGDLNLRDKELQDIGGIPDGVTDVWESTGRRPEAMYTWDMQRNDNLEWSQRFRPRCRFDRLYYRPGDQLNAVYFELIGLERLSRFNGCQRFPSDHWGIVAHFDKKD